MNNKRLLIIFILLFPFFCFSQDGTLDTSFGIDGYVQTDFYENDDVPHEIGEQSNGKLIVIGSVVNGSDYLCTITRYLPDGGIDPTFGINGSVESFGESYCQFSNLQIQNDDKIIVSGELGDELLMMRFLPNGILDSTFGTNGVVTFNFTNGFQLIKSTILLDEEKILLIGESENAINLIKYHQNGTIDSTFGENGITSFATELDSRVFEGKVRSDGKILVSARYTDANYDDHIIFLRFLENGSLDLTFGDEGFFNPNITFGFIYANPIALDDSNRIVVAYGTYDEMLEIYSSSTYRIQPDGGLDETFGNNGFQNLGSFSPSKIIIQTNNRILIGGGYSFFEGSSTTIKRVLENGNMDSSFSTIFEDLQRSNFSLLNSGKIIGLSNTFWFQGHQDFVLSRYNNDPLGIEDQQLEKFSVFPNPSNGIFKIQHDYLAAETPYLITDILGKTITKGYLKNDQTEINLTTMKTGVYFLSASNKTIKLLKN
jgi:uncharacterized delta-60 repeat protein